MSGRVVPLVLVLGVFIWSSVKVATTRIAEQPADTKVIRIGHWQLEASVREAFDKMGGEFADLPQIRAKYGKVKIAQDAIPEGTYGPWVSTNMVAGTAPDIVEIGQGLPYPIWLSYQARYFVPLSQYAGSPNPFNVGTPLEGVPLKNTYGDAMRSGYREELQEYMAVPLCRFAIRAFYNRTLLKQLTGIDHPPTEFRAFLRLCDRIRQTPTPDGRYVSPLAGSKYHASMWESAICDPLTWSLNRQADFSRDGSVGSDELFSAIRTNAVTFDTPALAAKFKLLRLLLPQFQSGFAGLTRDEAVMMFAQQKAVFISSGTWDAGSLLSQAKESGFDISVMAFPLPSKDDPEFGSLVKGPIYDPAGPGFSFGVTRFSQDPELAIDFLRFLASKKGNEDLNAIIGWIPSIEGAAMPPSLAGFEPCNQGMWANLKFDLGGETVIKYQQELSLLHTDLNYTFDAFKKDFVPFYLEHGLADFKEQQRDWRRAVLTNERFATAMRGEALEKAPNDPTNPLWVRYRAIVQGRLVFPDMWHAEQDAMVKNGPTRPVAPFDYLPGAMDRVRRDAAAARANGRP